jgi:hypothetical protein
VLVMALFSRRSNQAQRSAFRLDYFGFVQHFRLDPDQSKGEERSCVTAMRPVTASTLAAPEGVHRGAPLTVLVDELESSII